MWLFMCYCCCSADVLIFSRAHQFCLLHVLGSIRIDFALITKSQNATMFECHRVSQFRETNS